MSFTHLSEYSELVHLGFRSFTHITMLPAQKAPLLELEEINALESTAESAHERFSVRKADPILQPGNVPKPASVLHSGKPFRPVMQIGVPLEQTTFPLEQNGVLPPELDELEVWLTADAVHCVDKGRLQKLFTPRQQASSFGRHRNLTVLFGQSGTWPIGQNCPLVHLMVLPLELPDELEEELDDEELLDELEEELDELEDEELDDEELDEPEEELPELEDELEDEEELPELEDELLEELDDELDELLVF